MLFIHQKDKKHIQHLQYVGWFIFLRNQTKYHLLINTKIKSNVPKKLSIKFLQLI